MEEEASSSDQQIAKVSDLEDRVMSIATTT